ncbi:MAG: hypothetical protein IKC47_02130, partial [Clostridia bacterium]|nr:hypothetical protein [Clostridia bacterium]
GHTSAIKRVAGVEDGIQLTIPSKRAVARAACGRFATDTRAVCKRLCYVVAPNKKGVKEQIAGIKEYFEGYKTIVRLVSGKRLARIKRRNLGHKGRIVFVGDNARMQFCLATHNNALLTAEIALAYAKIVPLLNKNGFVGALDCFDIPLKYLCKGGEL